VKIAAQRGSDRRAHVQSPRPRSFPPRQRRSPPRPPMPEAWISPDCSGCSPRWRWPSGTPAVGALWLRDSPRGLLRGAIPPIPR